MKKYIGIICWMIGAVNWLIVSSIYFSEGKTFFAVLQIITAVFFVINGIRGYLKQKKSE